MLSSQSEACRPAKVKNRNPVSDNSKYIPVSAYKCITLLFTEKKARAVTECDLIPPPAL